MNPNDKPQTKQTYGFKSLNFPKPLEETQAFEEALADLIKNIEFRQYTNTFQQKLNNEKENIEKETKVFVGADKTTNFYKMSTKDYKEIVKKNVEAEYKKEKEKNIQNTNKTHNCK